MSDQLHWQQVYTTKPADAVSWYQADPALSVSLIAARAARGASVLDVGGGASRLVDELLNRGYRVGVLDLAGKSLQASRDRLGKRAAEVEWFEADVTTFTSPHVWDVWHDRAVFHFLTDPADRLAYRQTALNAIRPGGTAILATFALTGPEKCSGLPVARYDCPTLSGELGPALEPEHAQAETHRTPDGRTQDFNYCVFRRS